MQSRMSVVGTLALFVLSSAYPAVSQNPQDRQAPQTRPAPASRPANPGGGNRPNPGGGNRPKPGGGNNNRPQPGRPNPGNGNNRPQPSRPNPNPGNGNNRPQPGRPNPGGNRPPSRPNPGRPPQWGRPPQNRPSYNFRPNNRSYLHNYYRRSLLGINRLNRPRFTIGGFFPFAYIPYITPLPPQVYGQLPPPPPGYSMGYYDGYVVVYDPITYFIANVVDLLD
jgi:hypothetical protein